MLRRRQLWFVLVMAPACLLWSVTRTPEIPFEKHTIDLGASEACAFADINGDRRLDIVSGEFWYEAPGWKPHRFRELAYDNNYVDNFSDLAIDVNGDGLPDVVSGSYFTRRLAWWKNPGKGDSLWAEQAIETGNSTEFAFLVDIDNDGKAREVLPQFGSLNNPLTWYEVKDGGFVKHVVSPKSYGHGIGAGDVNGDGRTDILTPKGWFEAPLDVRNGDWKWHGDWEYGSLGFMHVLDVNKDGRNDIVTSMAHDYGIFWIEQGASPGQWTKHLIDDSWSQSHALSLVDLNGDGQKDILTGKRYMAHNGHDPGEREPLGIYWYEHRNDPGKPLVWVRHVIDYSTRTGSGMQFAVADSDGDGDLDFAVGGKSGLFLFKNLTRKDGGK